MKSAVTTASELSTPGEPIPCKYRPFREERGIRLLRLLPTSAWPDIRMDFCVYPSADGAAPEYEALSYAWGSHDPVDILVQASESSFCTLPVTQNLAEALHHLRHEDKPHVLWIDAICVNQQDMDERNS